MNDCRICLKCAGNRDIFQLGSETVNDSKSFCEILCFCLDIVISPNSKLGRKLCSDCYRKILDFEQFKTLALQNNAYWHNLQLNENARNEVLLEYQIKCENSCDDISNNNEIDIKEEVAAEDKNYDLFTSDDELLSAIKQIKCENGSEESKENDPLKRKLFKKKKKEKKEIKVNVRKNQICEKCGKTVVNLTNHRRLHKSVDERKCYKCKLCDKTFSSYSARYKHNKIKHLGIKSKCDICDKVVVNLRSHKLVVHHTGDLQYVCVSCGKRFISQSALDLHSAIHTKRLDHACDICDKKFRCKITMVNHKRQVHDKEKSHLCQICSKSFFKKYHLQVHIRSHTKEKPYQCSDCEKCFATTTILKNHKSTHTAVKNFECSLCDMTFTHPRYIRNHMVSHTKEKRYCCKYCDARFGRSDHRKRHEHSAHERNYSFAKT